jgi:hypothetical protein
MLGVLTFNSFLSEIFACFCVTNFMVRSVVLLPRNQYVPNSDLRKTRAVLTEG